jgi:hypothetical protein
MNRFALGVFLIVCFATLPLIISACTNIAAGDQDPGERVCGGVAGIECPEGYKCRYPEPNFPDAQGVCKKSDEPSPPGAAEDSPNLPPGLRFEVKYQQLFLEGGPSGYYRFMIWLSGDSHALHQIRSVEYELPEAYFPATRIKAGSYNDYFIDGTAPAGSKWDIIAVITWKDGISSAYAIPFRPR